MEDLTKLRAAVDALTAKIRRNWSHIRKVDIEVYRARIEAPGSERLASAERRLAVANKRRLVLCAERDEASERLYKAMGRS